MLIVRVIVLTLFLGACSSLVQDNVALTSDSPEVFVANYEDFGVSHYSSKLLGRSVWQWDDIENHRPVSFNIKVVVYRGVSLEQVKGAFPVIPEQKQDYRYVEYTMAVEYFTDTINELDELMKTLTFEEAGEFYIYPRRVYKGALAMERKLGGRGLTQ